MRYIHEVFSPLSFDEAKHVVLTSDPNDPNKFERETDFFINVMATELYIDNNTTIHDFGCGMGRISKKIIERFDCNVIGTDLSERMLTFATLYISKPNKFSSMREYINNNSIDIAVCSLVLQHVEDPAYEIKNITNNIKINGYLILLNENERLVPLNVDSQGYIGWVDDKFNIQTEIEKYMTKFKSIPYVNDKLNIVIYKKEV
jgi:SAM-dependent methyltransferase